MALHKNVGRYFLEGGNIKLLDTMFPPLIQLEHMGVSVEGEGETFVCLPVLLIGERLCL